MTRLLCMRLGTGQPGATLVTCILRDGSPRTQADMWSSVPSLNFHYTTFCRPGGGRDPGPGWIPAFAGMTNRTGLLGFQPCSLVTSFARQHTSVPSLNFHYTTFCRPGGGRDPGPGWIPAFAGMTNRTGLLGFQP